MAFDGVFLSGIIHELNNDILTGRVEKIYQPEKDEIHILIRCQGRNFKLLLSASASHPRIHITSINKDNPPVPPLFCMVLRKHLAGSRIISISQPCFERIAIITFEGLNEMGDVENKQLIIEIMGKHSNIILTDCNGRIIDSIKRVNESVSRVREVLPGIMYAFPPARGKTNPLDADEGILLQLIENTDSSVYPARLFVNSFIGISKASAEEITYNGTNGTNDRINIAACNKDKLIEAFIDFFSKVKSGNYNPIMLLDDNEKPMDILPFYYNIYAGACQNTYESFGGLLDAFYTERDRIERIRQRSASLNKLIKTNIERCEKKIALQTEEIIKSEKADEYRLMGELLTANLHAVKKGAEVVSVANYYDPESKNIDIPLDPVLTPSQNAQAYYKKYNKAKTALSEHRRLLDEAKSELAYLESIAESLGKATNEQDLLEIREELENEGYIRKSSRKINKKQKMPGFYHYISSDNFDIYVGKNNIQNDYLTLKFAAGPDMWLHTKTIPGSHVIIKSGGKPVPEKTLQEAANLAAYYSKGRFSSNVPVDYCPRKNVKKPAGAKPGMVVYERYNTVYITPSEDKVLALRTL